MQGLARRHEQADRTSVGVGHAMRLKLMPPLVRPISRLRPPFFSGRLKAVRRLIISVRRSVLPPDRPCIILMKTSASLHRSSYFTASCAAQKQPVHHALEARCD